MTAIPPKDKQQNTEQAKNLCQYCKKPGHVIRDCRKRMRKKQEQRNDPSIQNTKPWTSELFAPCLHSHWINHPPETYWSDPNTAKRPKRFKQEFIANSGNDGQDQGNRTQAGPSSIVKNPLN